MFSSCKEKQVSKQTGQYIGWTFQTNKLRIFSFIFVSSQGHDSIRLGEELLIQGYINAIWDKKKGDLLFSATFKSPMRVNRFGGGGLWASMEESLTGPW